MEILKIISFVLSMLAIITIFIMAHISNISDKKMAETQKEIEKNYEFQLHLSKLENDKLAGRLCRANEAIRLLHHKNLNLTFVKKVYFNHKTRMFVVEWIDNTKTESYVDSKDEVNFNVGFAMCFTKKYLGNDWRQRVSKKYNINKKVKQ